MKYIDPGLTISILTNPADIDSHTADEPGIGNRESGTFGGQEFGDWWFRSRSSYSAGFRQRVEENLLPNERRRE